MSQIVRDMIRDQDGKNGRVYFEKLTLSATGKSDVVIVPPDQITAIGVVVDELTNGNLQFTMDDLATIKANSAIDWTTWDGTSVINSAITAFQLVWIQSVVTAKITLKTVGF
jgi:hypothetical protein